MFSECVSIQIRHKLNPGMRSGNWGKKIVFIWKQRKMFNKRQNIDTQDILSAFYNENINQHVV